MLAPPPLFRNSKEFILVASLLLSIVVGRLLFEYKNFNNLKSLDSYYCEAQVENIYRAKSKFGNDLLKLKTNDGMSFYLYAKSGTPNRFDWVRVRIKLSKNSTFFDYLKGFFAYGEILEYSEEGFDHKAYVRAFIDQQHNEYDRLKSFYHAIFLADPLDTEIRDKISYLGVSHLVAISGFHLGILWLIVFGFLYLPYRYFQERYFPWRYRDIDLSFLSLIVLALFTLFVGAPPAIIRSYVMLFIGWLVLVFGLEVLSFRFLLFALLIILVVTPKLIVSFGLILSISGVYYIFLIIKWLKGLSAWFISLVAIPIGVFLFMFPIGHIFFPETTIWQLSSPLLSVAFILFYPIVAIMHALGFGGIFDSMLITLFDFPHKSITINMPKYLIVFYMILSFGSIFSKKIFYFTLFVATIITTWYMTLYILSP